MRQMTRHDTVYKIVTRSEWSDWQSSGMFVGAPVDRADGFIHLSTRAQVAETAARHFAGRDGLVLVALEAAALGPALRFEPARGGDLFPHLYGPLPVAAIRWSAPLPRDGTRHVFPELDP